MTDFYEDEHVQQLFFHEMAARYALAAARHEEAVRLVVAGVDIELRFASAVLREILLPALRHLIGSPPTSGPELTISIWDRVTSGVPLPPPPFDQKRITDRGDIWGFASGRFRLAFHYGEFSVNGFDRDSGQGFFWVDDPAALPYWTSAAPLRSLLHWCMELKGRQLLHAAAVGTQGGAVLLTGRGGIGKSSTALAAMRQGMDFAGDDYVVVDSGPVPRVYPLYSSAKVNRDQLPRFDGFRPWLRNPQGAAEEKAVFDLLPGFAAQIPASMPIRAILVPEINGRDDSAIAGGVALNDVRHAASLTTIEQLPYAGKYTYRFIDALTCKVPAYRLDLGRDQRQLAATLKGFLAISKPHGAALPARADLVSKSLPLVTVVVPAYNRERLLCEVVANIREQAYPNLEIIVVDDGSTDGTAAVARSLSGLRVFEQPNAGPAQARNRGVINARGDYLAFIDSDDLWPAGMLHYLVEALERDAGTDVVRGWPQLARIGSGEDYEFEGNPVEGFPYYITGSVFRREVFSRVGLFDPELRFGEDSDWFARAREAGAKVTRLDCVSVIVRRHGGNMTYGKDLVQLNVLRVAKKVLDRRRAATKAACQE